MMTSKRESRAYVGCSSHIRQFERISFLIAEPAGKARQRSSIAKEIW